MSNVTVQEALKKLIEYIESTASFIPTEYDHIGINVVNTGKAALVDIDKCEPVAYIHTATNTDKDGVEWVQLKAIDTSPQPRDCEPVIWLTPHEFITLQRSQKTDRETIPLYTYQQLNTKG